MTPARRMTFAGIIAGLLVGVPLTYGLLLRDAVQCVHLHQKIGEGVASIMKVPQVEENCAVPGEPGNLRPVGHVVETDGANDDDARSLDGHVFMIESLRKNSKDADSDRADADLAARKMVEKRRKVLLALIRASLPTARVDITVACLKSAPDGAVPVFVMPSGIVTSAEHFDRIRQLSDAVFKGAEFLDGDLHMVPPQTIVVGVVVLEVNHSEAKRIGWRMAEPGQPIVSGLGNVIDSRALAAFLQEVRASKAVKILAEPRLVTISGRPANFVDGGMVEVITASAGGSSVSQVQIGSVVSVVPIALDNGKIHLDVAASVSQPNSDLGVSVSSAESFASAPGLATQGQAFAVQTQDGETVVIGGLMHKARTGDTRILRLIGDLPLVGPIATWFLSREDEIEQVLLITPRRLDRP